EKLEWPSAAQVVLDAVGAGGGEFRICEADPERRKSYCACPSFTVSGYDCGWDELVASGGEEWSLILIDPYDFLQDWRDHLDAVVDAARGSSTMVYIYNRSGRKKEFFREYRKFRNRLDDLWASGEKLIGRVAADSFLPDSYHEMLFLPSKILQKEKHFTGLLAELESYTLLVAGAVGRGLHLDR
ncbi:MAG: hypothetical protein JXR97_03855, partial [Planctomycetes bacterium]|nr:hypothetical protein [Planctomycetota bacterium]